MCDYRIVTKTKFCKKMQRVTKKYCRKYVFYFWAKLILHNSQFYSSFWGLKRKKSSYSRLTGYLFSEMLLCVKSWLHREPDVTAGPPVLQSYFSRSTCGVRARGWTPYSALDENMCSFSQNPEHRHETDPWNVPNYQCHRQKSNCWSNCTERSHRG